jgi:hypothetical protein
MNYNTITVTDITDDSGPIEYPVTLTEVKNYLRLSDWEDTDDSPSTYIGEFNHDDILLTDMIVAATELLEEVANISITPHTKLARIYQYSGNQLLPYGPVIGSVSATDVYGTVIPVENYFIRSGYFVYPYTGDVVLTYTTGYGDVLTGPLPMAIKIDILRLIAYMYTNRGEDADVKAFAWKLAAAYSRNSPII